jgi:hypothetical protein
MQVQTLLRSHNCTVGMMKAMRRLSSSPALLVVDGCLFGLALGAGPCRSPLPLLLEGILSIGNGVLLQAGT